MALAKLTLWGMWQYGKTTEEYDLFDALSLPEDIPDTSDIKDALQTNILERGGEFEVLYAEPQMMMTKIALWSYKWAPTILRWYKALNTEYNPLENYDRMEDWRDDTSDVKDRSNKIKRDDMSSGVDNSIQNTTGDVENKVSAYDQSTYQPSEKNETSGKSENNSSRLLSSEGNTKEDEKTAGMTNSIHSGRTHGNIGVTTSQQMLQQELDIARFNFLDEVTDLFMRELLIYTY